MARKMKRVDGESVVTVHAFGVTKHFWEYYILDNAKSDYRLALVEGFEQEMGDISMSEIKPYLLSFTHDVSEIAPAPGWEWVD
jgi:hypothetical protein